MADKDVVCIDSKMYQVANGAFTQINLETTAKQVKIAPCEEGGEDPENMQEFAQDVRMAHEELVASVEGLKTRLDENEAWSGEFGDELAKFKRETGEKLAALEAKVAALEAGEGGNAPEEPDENGDGADSDMPPAE